MDMREINGRMYFVPDHALHMVDGKPTVVKWDSLSDNTKAEVLHCVMFGDYVFGDRDMFKVCFKKAEMMVVDVYDGDKDDDYYDILEARLREFMSQKDYVWIPLSGLAGAKQGGKKYDIYLFVKTGKEPISLGAKFKRIFKELFEDISASTTLERIKKIVGHRRKFKKKPRVYSLDYDIPGMDGHFWVNPEFRISEGLPIGFKLAVLAKDTGMDYHGEFNWPGYDIVLQKSGKKINVSDEKFSELVEWNPVTRPDVMNNELCIIVNKSGEISIGRDINVGLDRQAMWLINPRIDFRLVTKLLRWQLDDEVRDVMFSYKDTKTGKLKLSILGRDIFEDKLDMSNNYIRKCVCDIAFNHIINSIRSFPIIGKRGQGASLEACPEEVKKRARTRVVFKYPLLIGGIGKISEYENLVPVDPKLVKAMNADFDSDLFESQKIIRVPAHAACTIEEFEKYYRPSEKKSTSTERDLFAAMFKAKKQARLCGMLYNRTQVLLDEMRVLNFPLKQITYAYLKLAAENEDYLQALKHDITKTTVEDMDSIRKKFGVEPLKKWKVPMFFNTIRAGDRPVNVKDMLMHRIKALAIRAEWADPRSRSYNERAVAACLPLKDLLKPYWDLLNISEPHPEISNSEPQPEISNEEPEPEVIYES